MKRIIAISLASVAAMTTAAVAGPGQPKENGAFVDQGDYVTNGKVNFSDEGAMRSLNGQGALHANENSVHSLKYQDQFGGSRVEPHGRYTGE